MGIGSMEKLFVRQTQKRKQPRDFVTDADLDNERVYSLGNLTILSEAETWTNGNGYPDKHGRGPDNIKFNVFGSELSEQW